MKGVICQGSGEYATAHLRRSIELKQAAKRLAELNVQNMETQAYDADAAAQSWGTGLASASVPGTGTLKEPLEAAAGKFGEVEEAYPETQVVLTPPRLPKKKLPMPPPSLLEPEEKGSSEKLDPTQDAQVPLEATPTPRKLDLSAAEACVPDQPHNTSAAEEKDPPPDQAENTLTVQDEAAAVVPPPAPQPNNTPAAEKEDPAPDQKNTHVAQDAQDAPSDSKVDDPKADEANVAADDAGSSESLLKIAEPASSALDDAIKSLSLEPDEGVPVPRRVEQFIVRDALAPRGRGRGKGNGRGNGGRGRGRGRGRGKKVMADRPEGPEKSEPIGVYSDGEPDLDEECVIDEPLDCAEVEEMPKATKSNKAKAKAKGQPKAKAKGKAKAKAKGQPKAKAKGKAKAKAKGQRRQKRKQRHRCKSHKQMLWLRTMVATSKTSSRLRTSPCFLVVLTVNRLPSSLAWSLLTWSPAPLAALPPQASVAREQAPQRRLHGGSSQRRTLRKPGSQPSVMCSGIMLPRSLKRWGKGSVPTRTGLWYCFC